MADYKTDTSTDEDIALFTTVYLIDRLRKRKRKRHEGVVGRWWVQPWLDRREEHGVFHKLSKELREENPTQFHNMYRMELHHFDFLLERVSRLLPDRVDTCMRNCISKSERFEVTLRFLATGDSYRTLSYMYRISRQSLGKIIPETCTAIHLALKDYLKVPSQPDVWKQIAAEFENKWHFPNCLGTIDGKHIALKASANSGSHYFNYKHFHSIILLAVVDAQYRFITYDLGVNGRNNDAGIFVCVTNQGYSGGKQQGMHSTTNPPPPQTGIHPCHMSLLVMRLFL